MKSETIDIIAQKRNYYAQMAKMCDDVLNGKSMVQVCSENNMSVPAFRGRIFRNDSRVKSIPQEELAEIASSYMSPEESILKDVIEPVIGQYKTRVSIEFPSDFESTLYQLLDEIADNRTKQIIIMYYYERMSYESIGRKFNISRSRVGEILHRIHRMLRRSDRLLRLIYGDSKYHEYIRMIKYNQYYRNLMGSLSAAQDENEIHKEYAQKISEILQSSAINHSDNDSIRSLNLDCRTYNGLIRGGIKTIRQLLATSDKELMKIRGFGTKCLSQLNDCLKANGYVRNAESLDQSV